MSDPRPTAIASGPDAAAPAPPPLPPAQPIPYHQDADSAVPWLRVVKAIGTAGLIVAAASIAVFGITLMPVLGLPSLLPFTFSNRAGMFLGIVPSTLLLVGSVGWQRDGSQRGHLWTIAGRTLAC